MHAEHAIGRLLTSKLHPRVPGDGERSSLQAMPNSFDPGYPLTNARASIVGQPRFACELASVVAMPIWFVGLLALVNAKNPIDNPAGIPIYALMCLVLSAFVLPVNAIVIAPQLAKLSLGTAVGGTFVHLIVGTIASVFLWSWPPTMRNLPSLNWTIIPYYLCVFFFPPMLFGSYAYSLRCVALNRRVRTNNTMDQSPQ